MRTLAGAALCSAGLVLMIGGGARAADGRIQISQASVNAGGGFPLTISQSGASYVLTSDLVLPDASTSGIVIDAEDVTVDLNGFAIRGPGTPGSGFGVTTFYGNVVRNGSVYGVGTGVRMGPWSRVERVRVIGNGWGIVVGDHSQVTDSLAATNGSGISAGRSAIVRRCTSRSNTTHGITVEDYSAILDCAAGGNGGAGIRGLYGLLARGNFVSDNGEDGIVVLSGGPCAAIGNVSSGNTGSGVAANLCGYTNNVLEGNTGGTISTALPSVDLSPHGASNSCDGSTSCP
jgi:hypothetical protein